MLLCIFNFLYADVAQRGVIEKNPFTSKVEVPSGIDESLLPSNEVANGNNYYSDHVDEESLKKPIVLINSVVVFVDNDVITLSELDSRIKQTVQSLTQKGIPAPKSSELKTSVLNQLIMEQIQLNLAKKLGIQTNDIEVTETINNIAKQNKMTIEQFQNSLTKQNINYLDFRTQIERQIILEKLKQREIDAKVSVNEDEVNLVLKSQEFKNRIEYNLSDIIISIPNQANAKIVEQKKILADKAFNELESGVDFENVVAKYSNSPNALTGGSIGWKTNATLPPQILESLNSVAIGKYTKVIKLPVGYFIFKINDKRQHGTVQVVKQFHVRHILIKVNENTGDEEAHQKILMIEKTLLNDKDKEKQNQDFISLAKQYSQDTSSIKGGDIGWISVGDTVPAFEQVLVNIKLNTISQPVRTQFGWHIIEVLDVRNSNLTDDKEKAEIRQEIRDNKASLLYTQWLKDLRETAFVKINDN